MAEEAYYTYYINSAGEWVEPLSAVEFIFVNPAWVCVRNSHLQKGVPWLRLCNRAVVYKGED